MHIGLEQETQKNGFFFFFTLKLEYIAFILQENNMQG